MNSFSLFIIFLIIFYIFLGGRNPFETKGLRRSSETDLRSSETDLRSSETDLRLKVRQICGSSDSHVD